jgi:acetylornithine aminotransferase
MADEVQCGNARSGHYFAYQGVGIAPDVVTTAKGLGNGVPIGACLAGGAAADVLGPGHHGSTYGGNPLASAAGLAVVNTIRRENLADHAEKMGDVFRAVLMDHLDDPSAVADLRGRGLMLGIELTRDCGELVKRGLEAGLLINVTAGRTVRLLPPLIINDQEIRSLAAGVAGLINDFYRNDPPVEA